MADEQNNEGTEVAGDDSQHDQHLRKAIAERDALRNDLRNIKSRLAEFEAKDRKIEEERARAAGDFQALEKRLMGELEEERAAKAQLEGQITALQRGDRQRRFVDAIVSEGKIGNRELVEAMLPRLGLADDAPESVTPRDVSQAIKGLQSKAPELFTTTTGPKPTPRGGRALDTNDPNYWREVGANYNAGGLPPAYAAATNRQR